MRITTSILFFISVCTTNCLASVIRGTDSTYAGQTIEFFIQASPVTGEDSLVARTTVDSNGSFSVEINLEETYLVFSYPGIYKIFVYVEPNSEYNVLLPQYKQKTDSDRLNPFFQPVEVHLATIQFSENDLNVLIRMFNDAYLPYYNKHVNKVFTDKDFEALDKDIAQMDKPFEKLKNAFFNDYRTYKYGMLRMLAYQHKTKAISDQYFKGKPFIYNNPAYTELFNMVYEKYFSYFSRADENKTLAKALSVDKTYRAVFNALKNDEVLQPDELLNMVMLKCLHDEFYRDTYSRNALLEVLDSFIKTDSNKKQVEFALGIRKKVTRLLAGYVPPSFQLYDIDSNITGLEKFSGKYVYLNFCACFSYSCLNEFAMLQRLYEKHSGYLEIVTVIIDEDVEAMKDFVNRSGYSWTFLHFDREPKILQEYDIRAFPTYFLIDNYGKLVMSPAPSPAEEFEGRLFKELRSKGIL
jgi:peroxiredoxin